MLLSPGSTSLPRAAEQSRASLPKASRTLRARASSPPAIVPCSHKRRPAATRRASLLSQPARPSALWFPLAPPPPQISRGCPLTVRSSSKILHTYNGGNKHRGHEWVSVRAHGGHHACCPPASCPGPRAFSESFLRVFPDHIPLSHVCNRSRE